MASVSGTGPSAEQRERLFFLGMALLLVVTAVVGFGYFKLSGKSTFHSPWWVHLHAVSMVGWLGFFVLQNSLVVRGNVALHQRLGQFGSIYAVWIVLVGMAVGYLEVSTGRGVVMFTPPGSIALNWMNVLTFAGLFTAAFRMRHRIDWHKRLMLCALICLTAPAYGRTLVMFGARTNLNFTLFILLYVAIALSGDLLIHKRIHPAWLWGLAAAAFMGAMIGALPLIPAFASFAWSVAPVS